MRRIVSLFLAIAICVGLFVTPALASGEKRIFGEKQPISRQTDSVLRLSGDELAGANLAVDSKVPSSSTYTTAYKVDANGLKSAIDENETVYVIVELKSAPLGEAASLLYQQPAGRMSASANAAVKRNASLKAEQNAVMSVLKKADAGAKMLASYTAVINGFATEIAYKDLKALKSDSRVKSVYYSRQYQLPEPNDSASLGMVYASSAWGLGYRGDGMLIAILDTGMDYNHELLSTLSSESKLTKAQVDARVAAAGTLNATLGSYYKNEKVIFGYDYADVDEDPMDVEGHGTHVSGISAANVSTEGVVMGVAPNAQLMAMKVFSSDGGGAYDHWVLAAIDDAVKLGANAINMSLGFGGGFSSYDGIEEYTYDKAIKNARANGTIVNCSAGNESYMGPEATLGIPLPYAANPDYGVVGSPSTSTDAISVASVDNIAFYLQYFKSGDHSIAYTDTNAVPFVNTFHGQTLPFVAVPGFGNPEDFTGLDLTGKIALISRGGGVNFSVKANNAAAAGAVAAVVYNNTVGTINMDMTGAVVPAVSIEQAIGITLAAQGTGTMSFSKEFVGYFDNADTKRQISDFSSYGPTPDLKIKPEITAPGGGIYSTVPGGYGSMGGTSMAAPHVTGGSALVLQRVRKDFPTLTPAAQAQMVENLMMTAALPVYDSYDTYYPVQGQGAGLMDLEGAVSTPVVLYNNNGESKVELGDKLNNTDFAVTFTVENLSANSVVHQISPKLLVDYWVSIENEDDETDVKNYYDMTSLDFSQYSGFTVAVTGGTYTSGNRSLTLPANGKATVTVTFRISNQNHNQLMSISPNGYFVDGYIFLVPTASDSYVASIPFLGFMGDWLQPPAFDSLSVYESVEKLADVPFYWNNLGAVGSLFGLMWDVAGVNPYWIGDDDLAPADHVAFSPKMDLYNDYFGVQVSTLRNLKTMWVEIVDADGKVVRTLETDESYFYKSFFHGNQGQILSHFTPNYGMDWDGLDDNGDPVPEGAYTYKVLGTLDYPGAEAKPHSWGLGVTVDNTAPEVTYEIREVDGKYFADIQAKDNHYLSMVGVTYLQNDSLTLYDGTALKGYDEYEVSYDITDLVEELGGLEAAKASMVMYADDYASNVANEYVTPQPNLTGYYVRPYYYVSGLAAYMVIDVQGENLEGHELTAFVTDAWDPLTDIITLQPGEGRYYVSKMPEVTEATEFYLDLYIDGKYAVSQFVVILPMPDDLWAPLTTKTESGLQVTFSQGVQVALKDGAKLTMGDYSYTYSAANPGPIGLDGNVLTIAGKQDYTGKFTLSGVKFPVMFPSYSFTFTFTAP